MDSDEDVGSPSLGARADECVEAHTDPMDNFAPLHRSDDGSDDEIGQDGRSSEPGSPPSAADEDSEFAPIDDSLYSDSSTSADRRRGSTNVDSASSPAAPADIEQIEAAIHHLSLGRPSHQHPTHHSTAASGTELPDSQAVAAPSAPEPAHVGSAGTSSQAIVQGDTADTTALASTTASETADGTKHGSSTVEAPPSLTMPSSAADTTPEQLPETDSTTTDEPQQVRSGRSSPAKPKSRMSRMSRADVTSTSEITPAEQPYSDNDVANSTAVPPADPAPSSSISPAAATADTSISRSTSSALPSDSAASRTSSAGRFSTNTSDPDEPWHAHDAHFFILTNSGKPVFTHRGSEAALSSLTALITAVMSVVEDHGDTLQSVRSGRTLVVFASRGPLQLVATSNHDIPVLALQKQLELLYRQVVLIVTTGLERIVLRNPSYDVRNLLEGTSGVLGALIDSMEANPAYLFAALQPLPCPANDRAIATAALAEAVKQSEAFYGLLLVGDVVLALERGKHLPPLHPLDLLLLANFITCNPSHRYGQSESFCPVCLPHYNPAAFLHAYITYLEPTTGVYLVLLAGSSESFYALRSTCAMLQQHLSASGVLLRLKPHLLRRPEGRPTVDDLPRPLGGLFGEVPLWHYVLKVQAKKQMLVAGFSPPFATPAGRVEITGAFAKLNSLIFESPDGGKPNKLVWLASTSCAMLASIDRDSEAFLIFDPLTDKTAALEVLDALRRHFLTEPVRSDTFV